MRLIVTKNKKNKAIIIDKIKKENLVFFKCNSYDKKMRTLERDSEGFYDLNNKKFYYLKDFHNDLSNINNIIFYDIVYCNNHIRDLAYENIYLNKTEIVTSEFGTKRKYNNLIEIKEDKKIKNKQEFNSYLSNLNFVWKKDNKKYSVDLESQQDLINNINIYLLNEKLKIKQSILWHSYGEPYKEWQIEDLLLLYKDINKYIEQNKIKMKEYDDLIYKCQTVEEINAIEFIYE